MSELPNTGLVPRFWQVDNQGKVRTGKVMLYYPKTGKRVKNHTTIFHGYTRLSPQGFQSLSMLLWRTSYQ